MVYSSREMEQLCKLTSSVTLHRYIGHTSARNNKFALERPKASSRPTRARAASPRLLLPSMEGAEPAEECQEVAHSDLCARVLQKMS